MYGAGFILMSAAALVTLGWPARAWHPAAWIVATLALAAFLPFDLPRAGNGGTRLAVAGVQLEEESEGAILPVLEKRYEKYRGTPLFVLSEYSFGEPVPAAVRAWCARRKRWLVAGGKQFLDAAKSQYRNTAFVIGPDGTEVFQQAKSRPIQFFDDGLPAERQGVWESPWGKIGLCVTT